MAPVPPGEILAFVRDKIKKHTEQVNYHIERLETYRAIESGLCETELATSHRNTDPIIEGNIRTPDFEYEEEHIIPEWEANIGDILTFQQQKKRNR